jgi:uncharacterized delta-60 repeat protein
MSINQAPVLTTRDANGIVMMDFGSFRVNAPNAALQADGKIVVHGYAWNEPAAAFYSVLVRYNTDGSLDTAFGAGGLVISNTDIASFAAIQAGVALQADAKIVVGNDGFAAARYNSDGSFDTSFGTGGSVPALETGGSLAYGVVVEPDGKIVASGASGNFGLARFDSGGNLDPSFGIGGQATASFGGSAIDAHSLVAQPDGKLLVAGSVETAEGEDFALVRYNIDGSLDATFGTGGKVTRDFSEDDEISGVALQADGKIVVAGTTTAAGVLVRYNANGSIDSSFGIGGKVTTDAASSVERPEIVTIQSDGKIVVAGYSFVSGSKTDFALARYNSNGSLDSSFGSGGKVLTDIGAITDDPTSIVIQPDGKILVVGTSGPIGAGPSDLGLVRYNSDGSLDTSFGNGAALNGSVFFIEDGSATALNAGATVHDTELDIAGSYAGASLALARHGGANSEDVFSASGNLSALNQGGDLILSGVAIGTVAQNSGGMLVLAFGAAATEARVNEAMRSITYKDTSDTPAPSVQIDWSFSDGNTGAQGDGGTLAATGLTTVKITAFNDAPVNSVPGPLSAVAGTDFAIAGLGVSDPDSASLRTELRVSHGTLTVAAAGGAAVSGSGTATVEITGSPAQIAATLGASHNVLYHSAADFSGADTLSMTTVDGSGVAGRTASSSVALNVNAPEVNDAPVITIQGNPHLDVVTAHYGPSDVGVLIGDGLGGFSAGRAGVAGGTGVPSVAVGDVNGDGRLDIVTANEDSNTIGILIGDGRGGFIAGTTGIGNARSPSSVAVGDVNGDGKPDIVTANTNSDNVSILIGDGGGGFTASTRAIGSGTGPFSVALGDINGDGKLDIVTANITSANVSILLGDGHGAFTASTASVGSGGPIGDIVVLGDLNGDGRPDIVTVNNNTSDIRILIADAQGGFTASIVPIAGAKPISVALGDLDGDGKLDIVTANNHSDDVGIFTGDGHGGFAYRAVGLNGGIAPESVALGDINGDGKLDIVTANGSKNVSALINDGQGGFVDHKTALGNVSFPGAVALGDFDTAQLASEDNDFVFSTANGNAIAVGDADAGAGIETVSLGVLHGKVTLASGGVTVTGGANSSASVTFTGTIAQLNAALDGFIYRGVQDYNGQDTLTVTINDNGNAGTGGALTAVRLVPINIAAVNDAPVANNDSYSTSIDTTLTIAALGVLGNDTDQEGNHLTVSSSTDPAHGTLETFTDGSFTYTPDPGYTGPDSFTYFANDGAVDSAGAATVSITVNPVPGSIVISDQAQSEGDSGTQTMTFTVTRSGGTAAFDVNFATFDHSAAVADGDYVAKAGTLHFDAGVDTQTISVTVNGDVKQEANQTFFVNLSGATNGATISDSQGIGTIQNDDFNPAPGHFDAAGIWTPAGNGSDNTWHVGDFNGDGKADIFRYVGGEDVFLSNGTSFSHSGVWSPAGNGSDNQWHVGDFNGDGKDDIFRYLGGTAGADMFLSNGASFVHNGSWSPAGPGSDGTWHVGDFNGDGKADIFRYLNGEDVFLSDGTSFVHSGVWSPAGNGSDGKWYVGDFNGDGKDDIFRHIEGTGAQMFLSTGTSFVDSGVWTPAGMGSDGTWHVGDFNGDGKADIFRYLGGQSGADVFLSTGSGFVHDASWTGAGIGSDSQWYVGDFNGGGADDIFRQISGVDMLLSHFG